ncbi:MAG: hypothetical protein FWG78_03835 [Coriobacteriia bacterium]|nr:hypothetical protein [Coriobacteriia bacterium]
MAAVIVIAVTAVLLTLNILSIGPWSSTRITDAEIEAEISYLQEQSPELFEGEYATISADELRERIRRHLEDRNLLVAEAKKRGIEDVTEQFEKSYHAIESGYGGRDHFEYYLSIKGVDEKQLKRNLEANIIINELAKSLVDEKDLTEAELHNYYETNKSRYPIDFEKARAQVIADLLGKKRAEAIDELLESLRDV